MQGKASNVEGVNLSLVRCHLFEPWKKQAAIYVCCIQLKEGIRIRRDSTNLGKKKELNLQSSFRRCMYRWTTVSAFGQDRAPIHLSGPTYHQYGSMGEIEQCKLTHLSPSFLSYLDIILFLRKMWVHEKKRIGNKLGPSSWSRVSSTCGMLHF